MNILKFQWPTTKQLIPIPSLRFNKTKPIVREGKYITKINITINVIVCLNNNEFL